MTQRQLTPKTVTRDELNSLVDKAADLIRTAVDYKFILVLLFLKRMNDLLSKDPSLLVVIDSGIKELEAAIIRLSTRSSTIRGSLSGR